MLSQIPFDLPVKFLPGLASGEIVRYGTLLKHTGTGQILGHLQETGIAQNLISNALSSVTSPISLVSSVLNAGASVYTAVQVRQLKAMMETLQAFQIATLGVSLIGVGVSVGGFLYMRKRFNNLDSRLDKLLDTVKTGFENLEKSGVRQQMSRTKSLVQRAELARTMMDSSKEYKEVAAQLGEQAAYFEGEIVHLISTKGSINHHTFWLLAQLWMLCNSVRLDCQIRANELRNALHVSEKIAIEYQGVFERIGPTSFDVDHTEGRSTVRFFRDATDAAHTKPFLLDYLRTHQLDGPSYIESLEREAEQPMLFLKVS
jgi:hypothetical protein